MTALTLAAYVPAVDVGRLNNLTVGFLGGAGGAPGLLIWASQSELVPVTVFAQICAAILAAALLHVALGLFSNQAGDAQDPAKA
ncbi:MAG: hypothetical protein AAGA12_12970 [Pseudomonadota bacterium]